MHDSTLLKIAMIISIIGIIALFLILNISDIQEINISEAKELEEDASVKLSGVVESINTKEDFSILTIQKQEKITVVVFDKINLSKGQKIEVIGKTEVYRGEQEIIAEKIVMK